MSSIFSYDNKFSQMMMKIVNALYINILWLIWCVPVVTIGASTTAMYYTVNKVLRNKRSYVFQEFWGAFKKNFKQSTVIWLVLLVIGLILGGDIYIMRSFHEAGSPWGKFYFVFYMFLLLEVILAVYIFANIARFENTNKQIVKNAALMMVAHFPWSLLMMVLFVVMLMLCVLLPVVCIWFVPVVYMRICNGILERVFRRYMSEETLKSEDEKNRVYNG